MSTDTDTNTGTYAMVGIVRGCGAERTPGGVYAECGLGGENTRPLEHFLLDPPGELPPGLDLINKPQLWEDPVTHITHLLIWIGAEYYPYVPDYIEEVRLYGASRKLPPSLDFTRLVAGQSRMVLAHPRCRNALWADMSLPYRCGKRACHCAPCVAYTGRFYHLHDQIGPQGTPDAPEVAEGPCLFKTYDLVPPDAGTPVPIAGERVARQHMRTLGDTSYLYSPTTESARGLAPGLFAALPLTGFSLIKRQDGSVQEAAAASLARTAFAVRESEE